LRSASVTKLLLVCGACLVAQVALTEYGPDGQVQAAFWLALGLLMLWLLLRRRSRPARTFVLVTSFAGAILYALVLLSYPGGPWHSAGLSALYIGQAAPLLAQPVRDHVNSRTRAEATLPPTR
jgi:peptidoglycan/LPS O-acetylase OafA/YrhL